MRPLNPAVTPFRAKGKSLCSKMGQTWDIFLDKNGIRLDKASKVDEFRCKTLDLIQTMFDEVSFFLDQAYSPSFRHSRRQLAGIHPDLSRKETGTMDPRQKLRG